MQMLDADPFAWLHVFQRALYQPDGPIRRRAVVRVHRSFVSEVTQTCIKVRGNTHSRKCSMCCVLCFALLCLCAGLCCVLQLVNRDPSIVAKPLGGIAGLL